MEENYPHPPLTFKKWIENIWYYYKWLIITVAIFLVFIVVCIVQYAGNPEYDASILYVGPHVISNEVCDDIRDSSSKIMTSDNNSDGEYIIDLKTINLSTDYDKLIGIENESVSQYDALIDYNNELLAGDYCILLLDPYFYEQLQTNNILQELPIYQGLTGVPLKSLKLKNLKGFSSLDENTVLCIRYPASSGKVSDEELEKIYQNNYLFLIDMLTYEK